MRVRAILILDGARRITGLPGEIPAESVEVLGRSLAQHAIEQLRSSGIESIHVISSAQEDALTLERATLVHAPEEELWRTAEETFESIADDETRAVVLARLGTYAEAPWPALVLQHLEEDHRVTRVCKGERALEIYVVDGSRRNEAAYILRREMRETKAGSARYDLGDAYTNDLATVRDLRLLAADALYGRCGLPIDGEQVRPGVWVSRFARIEKGARVVAPAYIGRAARIHSGTVITRGSAIERHSIVDCGTIVEDSSVMPYCVIGIGLEISHAIATDRHLYSLMRSALVEINDPRLLRSHARNAAARVAKAAAALVSYLPVEAFRGFFGRKPATRAVPAVTAECTNDFATELRTIDGKASGWARLAPGLATLRRYGNQ